MALHAVDAGDGDAQDEMLARVGQMTRSLHDSLRGLGFDKLLERAAHDIPDARDRLDYVAKMTEQAAQRVLNATDAAGPLQSRIDTGAGELAAQWKGALEGAFSEEQVRALAAQTVGYLDDTRAAAGATRQHLLDIMMAQDFQDLTGQVIRKVTELAHGLEQQLVQLLIDYSPADVRRDGARRDGARRDGARRDGARRETSNSLLNGPQINPDNSPDIVANQEQVDDLLGSLGF